MIKTNVKAIYKLFYSVGNTAACLAERKDLQSIYDYIDKQKDTWLKIMSKNKYYGDIKSYKDMYARMFIKKYYICDEFPDIIWQTKIEPVIYNLTVLHLMNKDSDWYLPRIYKNIEQFLIKNSIDSMDKKENLIAGIIKARRAFNNRKHFYLNDAFKEWLIDEHEFKTSFVRRIEDGE